MGVGSGAVVGVERAGPDDGRLHAGAHDGADRQRDDGGVRGAPTARAVTSVGVQAVKECRWRGDDECRGAWVTGRR